jgi:hypothetical protein
LFFFSEVFFTDAALLGSLVLLGELLLSFLADAVLAVGVLTGDLAGLVLLAMAAPPLRAFPPNPLGLLLRFLVASSRDFCDFFSSLLLLRFLATSSRAFFSCLSQLLALFYRRLLLFLGWPFSFFSFCDFSGAFLPPAALLAGILSLPGLAPSPPPVLAPASAALVKAR